MSRIIARRIAISFLLCSVVCLSAALLNEIALSKRLEETIAVLGSSASLTSSLIEKGKVVEAQLECKEGIRYSVLFCERERLHSNAVAMFVLGGHGGFSKFAVTPAEKQRLEEYFSLLERKRSGAW
jgi:hypothetical protein